MNFIPKTLLKKLYTRGSLTKSDEGFTFNVKNRHGAPGQYPEPPKGRQRGATPEIKSPIWRPFVVFTHIFTIMAKKRF